MINGCAKKARKQSSPFDKKAVFDAIDKNHDGKIGKKIPFYLEGRRIL